MNADEYIQKAEFNTDEILKLVRQAFVDGFNEANKSIKVCTACKEMTVDDEITKFKCCVFQNIIPLSDFMKGAFWVNFKPKEY